MSKWVKLREGKGLPKLHGILSQAEAEKGKDWPMHYKLKAGHWLPGVDDETAAYLDGQYADNGEKLVLVADDEAHATQIALEEAQQGEPAVEVGRLPTTLTNDDLMRRMTARAADTKPPVPPAPKPKPKAGPSVDEIYARLNAVVGRKISGVIRDEFGDDVVDTLANEPDRLTEIDGVGANRLAKILEAVRDVIQ